MALPSEADQEALHERLYRLKGGAPPAETALWLEELAERYPGTDGFVFGCTELHLLARPLAERWGEEGLRGRVVDALHTVARRAPELAAGA
jgi:aspartate racemase